MRAFDELLTVVARLRAEDGCPWDRAQTETSMRPYLIEEAHEVVDAIDRQADGELRKEIGDALFVLVMIAQIASERGAFTLDDVLGDIVAKMIHRHPHVFDPEHATTGREAGVREWEARKAQERPAERSALEGLPASLPALLRAQRMGHKAAGVGFDWTSIDGVRAKIIEELGELDEAMAEEDPSATEHELGDLLFAVVNLSRHLKLNAEDALRACTRRFESRFHHMEETARRRGEQLRDLDPDRLENLWRIAKQAEV